MSTTPTSPAGNQPPGTDAYDKLASIGIILPRNPESGTSFLLPISGHPAEGVDLPDGWRLSKCPATGNPVAIYLTGLREWDEAITSLSEGDLCARWTHEYDPALTSPGNLVRFARSLAGWEREYLKWSAVHRGASVGREHLVRTFYATYAIWAAQSFLYDMNKVGSDDEGEADGPKPHLVRRVWSIAIAVASVFLATIHSRVLNGAGLAAILLSGFITAAYIALRHDKRN